MNIDQILFRAALQDEAPAIHLGIRSLQEATQRLGNVWFEHEEVEFDSAAELFRYRVFGFAERSDGARLYFTRSVALDAAFETRIGKFLEHLTDLASRREDEVAVPRVVAHG